MTRSSGLPEKVKIAIAITAVVLIIIATVLAIWGFDAGWLRLL